MKLKYQVKYEQAGVIGVLEYFPTLKQAQTAATEHVQAIAPDMKRYNCKKQGNLVRDGKIEFKHPAFGFEAGVYISQR